MSSEGRAAGAGMMTGAVGRIGAVWGLVGFVALLIQALLRLTPLALEPLRDGGLDAFQAVLYAGFVAFNAYAEGYRGFQLGLAPRFAARLQTVAREPTWARVLLAPAFGLSLFGARRGRLIASWALLIAIVLVVWGVRYLDQPWRGIIDGGVVVGLAWGLVVTVVEAIRVLRGRPAVDPELAESPTIRAEVAAPGGSA